MLDYLIQILTSYMHFNVLHVSTQFEIGQIINEQLLHRLYSEFW